MMPTLGANRQDPAQPDRRLGDEWLDWDGKSQSQETQARIRLFLGLGLGVVLGWTVIAWLAAWMVAPRFANWNAAKAAYVLAAAISAWLVFWYSALFLAAAGVKSSRWAVRFLGGLCWAIGPCVRLGGWIGISRDRVGHALIRLHNRLEIFPPLVKDPSRLLVLVPRCLNREMMQGLRELQARYQYRQVVAAGGNEARKAIAEFRPQGLIAVACERDLLSGLRDVKGRVPVAAFCNQRPEGPCKNTIIPLTAIEAEIRMILGQRPTNHQQ